jgi:ATP-dependent exoDNAse (exonuclease V) beta subunit
MTMHSAATRAIPPDQSERSRALDGSRCVLVQAPAGSGKTDLLTRRFLRLLSEVDEPQQIVAITFTKAAAAEMRHRILAELEKAAAQMDTARDADQFSMEALAQRALERSRRQNWNLIDLPAQLRISTIDSFCRELALQRPLLSSLGGGLDIGEQPAELYRRAARRTLESIDRVDDPALRESIEALLLWRDNGWREIEDQLVAMLAKRDRWMHGFVLDRDPDWGPLRERLEAPFKNAVRSALAGLSELLDRVPHAREEAQALARFACTQGAAALHQELAELAEFPAAPFGGDEELEEARQACVCLAQLLLTNDGTLRKRIDKNLGFPADLKHEKSRLLGLIADLGKVPGFEAALAAISELPPARYSDEDWRIVRACFALLRRAAAELQVVFAEAARADYIEVAQIAEAVLRGENEIPGEAALAMADGIRHLLVDEFQDTSRRQHQLLARLIAAWDERAGRTCFVVGDPMQSIYFFRDADAELFSRVEHTGLEIPHDLPLEFDAVRLSANFRTAKPLVARLNDFFGAVFQADDRSDVTFSQAEPARAEPDVDAMQDPAEQEPRMKLHVEFVPDSARGRSAGGDAAERKQRVSAEREAALEKQTAEIVETIGGHLPRIEQARAENRRNGDAERKKYRVAVLGRTHKALAPVAEALREADIPFRAVELEELRQRPEVLDALALARALLNPQDRVAWLGVLRAPWCGLSLADLHALTSGDEAELLKRPVPELIAERLDLLSPDFSSPDPLSLDLLSEQGRVAARRVLRAVDSATRLRFAQPAASPGTWIEQAWLALGGASCVDSAARANLDLLWRALDSLPEGEQDLLGPALDAELADLKALPDPDAESECGVQLMTIHKSKGLEFEVVVVPDLQAQARRGDAKLLSWLERGLAEPDDSGEPTEFLVAPLQSKGNDRGAAKQWVESVYHQRERQEMRRLLYVAATRAREELHLFARPAYKTEKDGSPALVNPSESLLAAAWPALEAEVRERFNVWREARRAPHEAEIAAIAASAGNVRAMPVPERGTRLRRLPADFRGDAAASLLSSTEPLVLGSPVVGIGQLYERHEGGVLSRALGVGVHALLEELARLRANADWASALASLAQLEPRTTALVRGVGIERTQAARVAARALEIALKAAQDATGQWILAPHADAASEVRWAGVVDGRLRTVQVDRVFRAGAQPLSADGDVWWIVDYKTAHEESLSPEAALPELRKTFAPQIEAYARVLRNLRGADAKIRGGLYYPRMARFDWWEI